MSAKNTLNKPRKTTSAGLSEARRALTDLCDGFFRDLAWIERCEVAQPKDLPQAVQHLLVHDEHMTPRLREHYGREMRLDVRADRLDGDLYTRKIELIVAVSGDIAEFGIMRIDLRFVSSEARLAILERRIPLGDVLVSHSVLTRVEPWAYLRVPGPSPIMGCLGRETAAVAYGRLARIHCNGNDAVELLEVVPDQ
jgi:chorismate-pyruvate lyase